MIPQIFPNMWTFDYLVGKSQVIHQIGNKNKICVNFPKFFHFEMWYVWPQNCLLCGIFYSETSFELKFENLNTTQQQIWEKCAEIAKLLKIIVILCRVKENPLSLSYECALWKVQYRISNVHMFEKIWGIKIHCSYDIST